MGYAMEYCPDGSVSDLIKNNLLSESKAMEIFWKIADAIQVCHKNNPEIIHRDIKPSNILIGLDEEPKLSDFGLALCIDPESERITTSNWISPGYSPPEQYDHFKECNSRSDIYSLGATLYTMLTNYIYRTDVGLKGIKDEKLKFLLKGMLKEKNIERFKSIGHIKQAWEILTNDISIRKFLSLNTEQKRGKINTYFEYFCGMEDDIIRLNQAAAYFLNCIIDSESDIEIIELAKKVFEHIDREGKILEEEMEQDNPRN